MTFDFASQILALFDSLPLLQFSKFGNFIWLQFLAENLSNFVSLPWKLHNQYYHNLHIKITKNIGWVLSTYLHDSFLFPFME